MDPEEVARNIMSAHIDAAAAVLETQIPALVAGAGLLARCLLAEKRIFTCGNGGSATSAQQLSVLLLGRLERERPGLPIFCLAENAALMSALADGYGTNDTFARQLRALGQAGDVLIVLSSNGNAANLMQAVIAAHDRGMGVLALTGHDGGELVHSLGHDDIDVRVPISSPVRCEEIHLLLINVLCDLLERELFGDNP